jgi:hypothetical protein
VLLKSSNHNRNVIGYIQPNTINNVGLKNPAVIAWWSAAFPGYGHILLGSHFIGFILLIHEAIMNNLSGLNTAIFYSFIGEFTTAKETLNMTWFLVYIAPYIFSIWDSYQRTIQLNEDYIMARQRGYEIITKGISSFGINRLDLKKPLVSIFWSILAPGSGHIYINQTFMVILLVPWLVIVTYFSNLVPAIYHTFVGDFHLARSLANPQWLLFLPSIYGFVIYDAYVHTLEYNELYKLDQKRYYEQAFQNRNFRMPF